MDVTAANKSNSVYSGLNEHSAHSSIKSRFNAKAEADSLILKDLAHQARPEKDKIKDLSESLYITAQRVIARLNEYLAEHVPGGIESLNPDEFTSEKTASRIVTQVTALFDAYAHTNSDKSPEELINGFMKAARKGIDQGYGEAVDILDAVGAFDVPGVKADIEKTKELIEEQLVSFEQQLREKFGLAKSSAEPPDQDPLLADKTGQLLDLVA